jgi:cyclomaltodextrinase
MLRIEPPPRLRGRGLYQLHSFGAAGVGAGGLERLQGWLDHVAALGAGGVLLTPIFASTSHGYDTIDPFRIDPRLGDEDAFAAFVAACHERDLALILDGVFNHVGRDFPYFQDVIAHGRDSGHAGWFRLDFDRDDGDGFGYHCFEGHRELVSLNHHNPAVADWAAAVAAHWLDRGADGWRLDAAYAIPTPFLASLTTRIREHQPDAFVFGEVIHGDYRGFVRSTGLHSVTQYELHKAIWSALNDANLYELAWTLKRHREFSEDFVPVTFVGNHDVTRIATRLRDPRHLTLAAALLFTLPGVPCVYYGDELAWEGVKEQRAGGDDAIRPPLPPDARPTDEAGRDALALHEQLIALRRERPWLTDAALDVLDLASTQMTYTVTSSDGALRVSIDTDAGNPTPPAGWDAIVTRPGVTIAERRSEHG